MQVISFILSFTIFNLLLLSSAFAANDKLQIVTSIAPLHALVSAVVGDKADVVLLVPRAHSPHDYQLKPSQVVAVKKANIVFYIDNAFELFLPKYLADRAGNNLALAKSEAMTLLSSKMHHDDHEHGVLDLHIWLDADNAIVMLGAIKDRLSLLQPEYKHEYEENYHAERARIIAADNELKTRLKPYQSNAFYVVHDGYRYFEQRYKLNNSGALTLPSNHSLRAASLRSLKQKKAKQNISCVIAEDSTPTKTLALLQQEFGLKTVRLNAFAAQAGGYPELLNNFQAAFLNCFGNSN